MRYVPVAPRTESVAARVVVAAFTVHRELGPGLLERMYGAAMAEEMAVRDLRFLQESPIGVRYRGKRLPGTFRADFDVEDRVLVEIKAMEQVHPVHVAQLLTYLRLTGREVGFLLNFHTPRLVDGLHRLVNTAVAPPEE